MKNVIDYLSSVIMGHPLCIGQSVLAGNIEQRIQNRKFAIGHIGWRI